MNAVLTSDISAIAVFLQGLFSFFSPCVLPLLPVYFGYLSGGTAGRDADGSLRFDRGRAIINTLFFILGISAAFFLLGLGASAAGNVLIRHQKVITRAGGILMTLFGLYQSGLLGEWGFLAKERRLPFRFETMTASPVTAFVFGFVFSFAWTPCVGPMLSSVLILAAAESEKGMVMILFYTLGFVIPFLLLGLFSETVLNLVQKHKGVMRFTVKAGGVLMIALGLLLFSGKLDGTGTAAPQQNATQNTQQTDNALQKNTQTQNATQGEKKDENTVAAIPFTLKDQYGKTHTLADYKGKIIFLNFWATWCPPCRAEMPDIQKLYERSPRDGRDAVIVLGVAAPKLGSEKDEDGIKAFMDKNGYSYPVLMDEGGKLFEAYGIRAIPTTYLIDRRGNVIGRVQGALSAENLEKIIQQVLQTAE
ncbi:cytochrome c biogenesis protein CcdA [Succiniclasticum ruminis]|uniref:Cytochrome c-type biogenesis protein n=1 Tax=Succiniclasticum ruminis DSM 9236 TaxID=1123323 RepID=A0A1I2BBT6_9FIRM|nr:cytochrome c biogenesis protein CcdA [Succiniclasticum ruminis]SFE53682.1 cytochrome c-type biogenesis protein [Succiniclasticum ruminis DSM 9236]